MDDRATGIRDKTWVDSHLEHVAEAWPELDMSVEALVTRIAKFQRYVDLLLSTTLKEFDLSQGEYRVLLNLKGTGKHECSPGELCDRMLVSSGSMTNRLDRLEEAGLIERKPDPSDRRGVRVNLTGKGDELISTAVYVQGRKEAKLFQELSDDERQMLDDVLRRVLRSLEDTYGPPPKKRSESEA